MRILLIEDDRLLLESLQRILATEFEVETAASGDEGLYLAEQNIYDVIVLDIMLPGMSGLDILTNLRKQGIEVPVLLLTARDSVEDKVTGLERGADDYLVKPFAMPELLARVRALLRRNGSLKQAGVLQYRSIQLRLKEQEGYVDGLPLQLTVKEFTMLEYLVQNAEQILTREQLYDRVWGFDAVTSLSIVELYVHYLRKKLSKHGLNEIIHTIRGVGYMLKEDD
ncbi:response regulator transcription factor [Desmospora profundinema]|uniref:DNA-binding response OmpR family regulator n=1 Tax=Desmospora profundinema TaxID=1571184 RepID=A0ABU1IQ74_9BACL|nr:response regulator transcription factor [Desmospora profundinema]MDR6226687.1 DNA-binding response OmpR family regulator [Desmospora profundinema]